MLKYFGLLVFVSLNILAYDGNCLGEISANDTIRTEVYLGHTVNGDCQPDNKLFLFALVESEGSTLEDYKVYKSVLQLVLGDFSYLQEFASSSDLEWKLDYQQKLSGANCVYIHMNTELGLGCCKAGINFYVDKSQKIVPDSSYLNSC